MLRAVVAAALSALIIGVAAVPAHTVRSDSVSTASVRPALIQAAEPGGPAAEAARLVAEMTVAEQAASIVMGHIPTTDAAALSAYMNDTGIGGFILMGANIPETESALRAVTAALAEGSDVPPLIAIDQEGGDVSRLVWDDFAAARTLKNSDPADTSVAFAGRAALVARGGANVNFGVVADTTPDASSFIYGRALGADPEGAAERVAAAVTTEEPAIASTLKHFPGHGAAPGDSHHLIPTSHKTLAEWEQSDAIPFRRGIDAGARLLMFGHLAFPAVDAAPASLSPRWHEIARSDLAFDGVIVTDDLGMLLSSGIADFADPVANAVTAVAAGNDLVLMVAHSTANTAGELAAGITAAVDGGTLSAERLQDAAERVMTLRLELAASAAVWAPVPPQ